MEEKVRQIFLTKISLNGFSIEDKGNTLVLTLRGATEQAEVIIQEQDTNWKVISASGIYARFARGKNKSIFEGYISIWATQSQAEAL